MAHITLLLLQLFIPCPKNAMEIWDCRFLSLHPLCFISLCTVIWYIVTLLSWQFRAFPSFFPHPISSRKSTNSPFLWQCSEPWNDDLQAHGAFLFWYKLLNRIFFHWWSEISALWLGIWNADQLKFVKTVAQIPKGTIGLLWSNL